MIISWLEATTHPFSALWTGAETASVPFGDLTGVNGFTYVSNWSETAITKTASGNGEVTIQFFPELITVNSESLVYKTVIGASNSTSTSAPTNNNNLTSFVTVASTRNVQTSTTESYEGAVAVTTTTESSRVEWSTSLEADVAVFYSTASPATSSTIINVQTTLTDDWTTEISDTQTHCGVFNTIYQCVTSNAASAVVAWTAPNTFSLTTYGISAFTDAASITVTRWTESARAETASQQEASLVESSNLQTLFVPAATSELICITTTTQQTSSALNNTNLFPAVSTSTNVTHTTTTQTAITLTLLPETTFTTANSFMNGGSVNPTLTDTKWSNATMTYTTGNGTITWHNTATIPSVFEITTQRQGAALEPLGMTTNLQTAELYAYVTNTEFVNNIGHSITLQGGLEMVSAKKPEPGVTFVTADELDRIAINKRGARLSQSFGAYIDLDFGKTFQQPQGITAYAGGRATNLSTIVPGSYSISDTAGEWSGTLSISGASASATFAPTNTNQSVTTATALARASKENTYAQAHSNIQIVGGRPADNETFFVRHGLAYYKNRQSETSSATPSVQSQTATAQTSVWSTLIGIAPNTEPTDKSVISYSAPRNVSPLFFDGEPPPLNF